MSKPRKNASSEKNSTLTEASYVVALVSHFILSNTNILQGNGFKHILIITKLFQATQASCKRCSGFKYI